MDKILIKDLNESYTLIQTNNLELKKKIANTLTVEVPNHQFDPLFRAGMWDGTKKFYKVKDTHLIITKGLKSLVLDYLDKTKQHYEHSFIDKPFNVTNEEIDSFIKTLNLPFSPYDYQIKALKSMLEEKRLVIKSCTGSGKSLMIFLFFMYLRKLNKNVLLVVPSISLVDQMFSDFKDYGFKDINDVLLIGGEHNSNKDLKSKPIVISTWQSLQYMDKESFDVFDAMVVDECHLAKAEALDRILKYNTNSSWKIGLTGTIPRDKISRLTLISTLGKTKTIITAGALIKRGLATPISIVSLYINYLEEDISLLHKNLEYKNEVKFIEKHRYRNILVSNIISKVSEKGNTLALFTHIEHGEELLRNIISNRIKTNTNNIELLHGITPKPLKELYNKYKENNNKVFYMNSKIEQEHIDKITKNLKKILKDDCSDIDNTIKDIISKIKSLDDINIYFITGEVKGSIREYIRKKLEEVEIDKCYLYTKKDKIKVLKNTLINNIQLKDLEDGYILPKEFVRKHNLKSNIFKKVHYYENAIILGNYQVTSTGVNFKNLHNIVFASFLKSYTKILQTIGRGMRLHDSKTNVNIYDIVDVLEKNSSVNYALKHFYERLSYYQEDEFPLIEKELKLTKSYITQEIEETYEEFI